MNSNKPDSEIYQNLLLIANAIDEISKIKTEYSPPVEWGELSTTVLFYNNNYKFYNDNERLRQYLQKSLSQVKFIEDYYNQQSAPEFNKIQHAIKNFISSIKKELFKLDKK